MLRKECREVESLDPKNIGPGQEQFASFTPPGTMIERIQYDYRHTNGELFSCISCSIQTARARRDTWIAEQEGREPRATAQHRKPYNTRKGYVRSARCHAKTGGWIVLYDRVKGFDDGGPAMEKVLRFRVQHEPSGEGIDTSRRTDADQIFKVAVKLGLPFPKISIAQMTAAAKVAEATKEPTYYHEICRLCPYRDGHDPQACYMATGCRELREGTVPMASIDRSKLIKILNDAVSTAFERSFKAQNDGPEWSIHQQRGVKESLEALVDMLERSDRRFIDFYCRETPIESAKL